MQCDRFQANTHIWVIATIRKPLDIRFISMKQQQA